MKGHSPKICTEWQFDNKVGFYKGAVKEDIDSKDLSKCKGVQFSLFSVCTKSIKVMTLVPTVKEKFQRSQRCRLRRTILRCLSSIQHSSSAHIWKREAAGWEKQQRKITACSEVAEENQQSHQPDTLLFQKTPNARDWKYVKIRKKKNSAVTSLIAVHYHPSLPQWLFVQQPGKPAKGTVWN